MNYFTTDLHETKREISIFSNKLSEGMSKPTRKFMFDMLYGITASCSCLTSEIARTLQEPCKLKNTIERLCDHLYKMDENEKATIQSNYMKEVAKYVPESPLILLDDSEIVKEYGKKFEDLCLVRDASSLKDEIKPGYHVAEAVVISEKQKQPIPIYSHVYSTESKGFKSMPDETIKSIKFVKRYFPQRCTFVGDRGYDSNGFFKYFIKENENKDDFVIRLKGNRNLLFKGKVKKCGVVAKARKGKVRMNLQFSKDEVVTYVSHTKVQLPSNPEIDLTLVIVYGLSEEEPMLLLTNKKVSCKEDVIRIVRCYMSRWRVEENFRLKKQKYGWEDMRVRSLCAINTLNLLLMMHIGHIAMLADKIDTNLYVIKVIERSKALRKDMCLWGYQIADGMKVILGYAQKGIRALQRIERKCTFKQLILNI